MLSTSSWGPSFWAFFHVITLNYPNEPSTEDMDMAQKLVKAIYYVLPCQMCSDHYYKNLKINPLKKEDVSSKKSFILWFINLHNDVNRMLNKKSMSFDTAMAKINGLTKYKYIDMFIRVLNKIDIPAKIDSKDKKYIIKFIKIGLYFGKIEIKKEIDFSDERSFRQIIKYIEKIQAICFPAK